MLKRKQRHDVFFGGLGIELIIARISRFYSLERKSRYFGKNFIIVQCVNEDVVATKKWFAEAIARLVSLAQIFEKKREITFIVGYVVCLTPIVFKFEHLINFFFASSFFFALIYLFYAEKGHVLPKK